MGGSSFAFDDSDIVSPRGETIGDYGSWHHRQPADGTKQIIHCCHVSVIYGFRKFWLSSAGFLASVLINGCLRVSDVRVGTRQFLRDPGEPELLALEVELLQFGGRGARRGHDAAAHALSAKHS